MLHNAFVRWEINTQTNEIKQDTIRDNPQTVEKPNRNASSLMQEIVLHSSKYKKDILPDCYSYNEDTGELIKHDIIPSLIPYTSDKTDVISNLEEEYESCKNVSWKQMPLCEKVKKVTHYLRENNKNNEIQVLRKHPHEYISCVTYELKTNEIKKIDYETIYQILKL